MPTVPCEFLVAAAVGVMRRALEVDFVSTCDGWDCDREFGGISLLLGEAPWGILGWPGEKKSREPMSSGNLLRGWGQLHPQARQDSSYPQLAATPEATSLQDCKIAR